MSDRGRGAQRQVPAGRVFGLAPMALLALATCAHRSPIYPARDLGPPTLTLRAMPEILTAAGYVSLTATLQGRADEERFWCLTPEWDFGDGCKSMQASDCGPWESGLYVRRTWQVIHAYQGSGPYTVRFRLKHAERAEVFAVAAIEGVER